MASVLTLASFQAHVAGIQERLATVNDIMPEQYTALDEGMDLEFMDHFHFQELKSEAFVMGRLDEEVAQAIYAALGEVFNSNNGGWAAGVELATKVAITKLMGELLSLKLGGRLAVA